RAAPAPRARRPSGPRHDLVRRPAVDGADGGLQVVGRLGVGAVGGGHGTILAERPGFVRIATMDEARTIPALVERAAERFGSREALVDADGAEARGRDVRRLSFAELAAAADEAALAYVAQGLEPGDRVAIWAPNSARWVVAALGAYRAGCVVTTVNTRFRGPEAAHVVGTAGARLLVTETDFLDTDYVARLGRAGRRACLDRSVVLRGPVPDGCVGWEGFLASASGVDPAAAGKRAAP